MIQLPARDGRRGDQVQRIRVGDERQAAVEHPLEAALAPIRSGRAPAPRPPRRRARRAPRARLRRPPHARSPRGARCAPQRHCRGAPRRRRVPRRHAEPPRMRGGSRPTSRGRRRAAAAGRWCLCAPSAAAAATLARARAASSRVSAGSRPWREICRQSEVGELDVARVVARAAEIEPLLQPDERDGRRRTDRVAERQTGVGVQTARDVEREDRRAAARSPRPRRLRSRPRAAGRRRCRAARRRRSVGRPILSRLAKRSIGMPAATHSSSARFASPLSRSGGATASTRNSSSAACREPRQHEPVARVVARAAEHDDRARVGPAPAQDPRTPRAPRAT